MRRVQQVASLVLLAGGLYVTLESRSMTYMSSLGPGPGFFPFWLGIIFAGMSLLWFGQLALQPGSAGEGDFFPDRSAVIKIVSILGALVVLAALMDTLGFQLTMFAFLGFLLIALGRQHPLLTLVLAALGSFGTHYVFTTYLDVPLPVSSIAFLQNLGL
ncbi:MAG: tripartite tricarboxylate transporter TctB family protein [Chloroflexota bacterium]